MERLNNKKGDQISRKQALKKAGKLAALTAATMLILNPSKVYAGSSLTPQSNTPRAPREW